MKKPRKHLIIFLVMGLIGTNIEILVRWLGNDLVVAGVGELRFASGAGWTSMWMLFVYGGAGVVLGGINTTRLGRQPMFVQALLGMALMVSVELTTGLLLNRQLQLDCWNYDGEPLNLAGQICAFKAVQFFFLAPLVYWTDDMIRFVAYDERRPGTLWSYYRSLVELAGNPQDRAALTAPTTLCSSCRVDLAPARAIPPRDRVD